MDKEQKSLNSDPKITSDIGYQPTKHVPAGSIGKKDGNKTKLS
jgi:hypothetical protein